MKEVTVQSTIYKWLKKNGFKATWEEWHGRYFRADITVKRERKPDIIIECKGSHGGLYTALGQCLCYIYLYREEYGKDIKVYLAIPHDFHGVSKDYKGERWTRREVNEILKNHLPQVGLIEVHRNRRIHVPIGRKELFR